MDVTYLGCYCTGLDGVVGRKAWLYASEDGMGDERIREEMIIVICIWMEFKRLFILPFVRTPALSTH